MPSGGRDRSWLVTAASATGKGHLDQGLGNQDCVLAGTSPDGRVVAAVVSDGAGSAAQAEIGSSTTCRLLLPWMLEIGHHLTIASSLDEDLIRDRIIEGIENVREVLSRDGALRDRHCTLIACVMTDQVGYVCQVGDSIGIATSFLADEGADGGVDFFPDEQVRMFSAERGEYANETHFITEPDFRDHLRVTRFPTDQVDALMLMTDGAMDIAMLGGKVYRGFMSAVVGTLLATTDKAERESLLHDWLSDRRTWPVTGDDKTMFVALRSPQRKRDARLAGQQEPDQRAAAGHAVGAGPAEPSEDPEAASVAMSRPATAPAWGAVAHEKAGAETTAPVPRGWHLAPWLIAGCLTLTGALAVWFSSRDGVARAAPDEVMPAKKPPQDRTKGKQAASPASAAPKAARNANSASSHEDQDEPSRRTADALPERTQALAAAAEPSLWPELVLQPRAPSELVLRQGASAQLELFIFDGGEPRVEVALEPSKLEVEKGACRWLERSSLRKMSCVFSVTADSRTPPGSYRLQVQVVDGKNRGPQSASLTVRVLKGQS